MAAFSDDKIMEKENVKKKKKKTELNLERLCLGFAVMALMPEPKAGPNVCFISSAFSYRDMTQTVYGAHEH